MELVDMRSPTPSDEPLDVATRQKLDLVQRVEAFTDVASGVDSSQLSDELGSASPAAASGAASHGRVPRLVSVRLPIPPRSNARSWPPRHWIHRRRPGAL